jgi:hypothetical protein
MYFLCNAAQDELRGCALDCQNMRGLLTETFQVPEENIITLVDDGEEFVEGYEPTKDNIEVSRFASRILFSVNYRSRPEGQRDQQPAGLPASSYDLSDRFGRLQPSLL